jgi:hypothetical protein
MKVATLPSEPVTFGLTTATGFLYAEGPRADELLEALGVANSATSYEGLSCWHLVVERAAARVGASVIDAGPPANHATSRSAIEQARRVLTSSAG